jgi:O-antigen/teichoic acid export membrane protein
MNVRANNRSALKQRAESTTRLAFRGMSTLASGSVASKLIALASLPVITRLYAPADIGALSVFTGLLMLMVPLLTLQYHRGLPVPNGDAAAANLMALCLALMIGFSILLWLGLWAGAGVLFRLLSIEALLPFWWLLPLGVAIYAMVMILQLWATRRRTYSIIAGAEVGQSLAGNGSKIGLALLLPPPIGLILGHLIGLGGGAVWLVARFQSDFSRLHRQVRPARILSLARRHRGLPLYRTPSQLILIASAQAPVFFIAGVYGAATAGQFGLALMALSMPMNLIGRNMGKAFFGEAAHLGRSVPEALRSAVLRVTSILATIGVGIALVLHLAAPAFFPLMFGTEWAEAGQFASILALYLSFQFAAAPVMNVLSVLGREAVYLQLDLFRFTLMALVFGIAASAGLSVVQLIIAYSLGMVLHYLLCILVVFRELTLAENVH